MPAEPAGGAYVAGALAVVLVAAALRLARLDLTVFEVDEASLLRITEDLVRLGRLPLSGPIFSTGIPSAPHFSYLLAPLVLVSRDPAVSAGAIAVTNILAVAASAWLGWRWFAPSRAVGLLAAAVYATSPLAVFAARRIWQPDLLPPLAVLLLVATDQALVCRRAWWAAATFPIVSLAVMVHPSFLPLAVFLVAPLWVVWKSRRWLPLGVGLLLAAAVPVPYLVHQVQTRWVDVADFRYFSSLHTWLNLDSLRYALALTTGWNPEPDPSVPPLDGLVPGWLLMVVAGVQVVLLALAIGVAVAAVLARWRHLRSDPRRVRLLVLVLWLVVPVAVTIRHTIPLQSHYFLATYPAGFMLMASLVALAPTRVVRSAVAAALGAAVLVQGVAAASALYGLGPGQPCYGPVLLQASQLAQELDGLGAAYGSTHAALELHAADGVPVGYLVRPQFPILQVAGDPTVGLGPDLARPAAAPPVEDALTRRLPMMLGYAPGVQVLELAFSDRAQSDQRLHLAIVWQVADGTTSNRTLVWDVTLRDPAGAAVVHQSGVDHVPAQLAGQRIVSWFSFDPPVPPAEPLPSGDYRVDVQLVDTFTPGPLAFVDQDGRSGTTWSAGPLRIDPPRRCGSQA